MTARAVLLGIVLTLDPCSKLGINLKGDPTTTTGAGSASQAAPPSVEQSAIEDAKKLCAQGDCQDAHRRMDITLPANSPLRQSAEFKDVENKWAAAMTTGAADDPDLLGRRRALEEVSNATSVDPAYQAKAKALLKSLPTQPAVLPTVKYDGGAVKSPLDQARDLADKKNYDGAKQVLLPRVSSGKGSKEEIALLKTVCKDLKDQACLDVVKKNSK